MENGLRGVCLEIFDLHFSHDWNPSGPLINRLKYFRIRFPFRRDIQLFKKLCGVHHTKESSSTVCVKKKYLKNSTVCIILWSQTPRCPSYHGVRFRGVMHTVKSVTCQMSVWSEILQLLFLFNASRYFYKNYTESHNLCTESFLV